MELALVPRPPSIPRASSRVPPRIRNSHPANIGGKASSIAKQVSSASNKDTLANERAGQSSAEDATAIHQLGNSAAEEEDAQSIASKEEPSHTSGISIMPLGECYGPDLRGQPLDSRNMAAKGPPSQTSGIWSMPFVECYRPDLQGCHESDLLAVLRRKNLLAEFGLNDHEELGLDINVDSDDGESTGDIPTNSVQKPRLRRVRAKELQKDLAKEGAMPLEVGCRRLSWKAEAPSGSSDDLEDEGFENVLHKLQRNVPRAPDTFTLAGSAVHMIRHQRRAAS